MSAPKRRRAETPARVTIGQLAKLTGVRPDTVRFYERMSLLPPARRAASGYRYYGAEDVERLRFIRRAKELGFALEEITELLTLGAAAPDATTVRQIASRRIARLDAKIRQLVLVRDTLALYVDNCSMTGPAPGCPIVEALLADEDAGR